MSRSAKCVFALALVIPLALQAQQRFDSIGRPATSAEIKAWDIDVRADFKGLPKGQGSVAQGEKVWGAQCASCHGDFGESNEVFTPIAGGTTAKDIETGRVAGLLPGANSPQRTTLMKLSSLSTLWDYINRAMPWTAPKSLSADEVYAVTAYILNLGNVLPSDFVLSNVNIREVQNRLPNRKGTTTAHALWPGHELGGTAKPDVQGSLCMRNCTTEPRVASFLPDYARNAHGNLAEQSRGFGAIRGADTSRPARGTLTTAISGQKVAETRTNTVQDAPKSVASSNPVVKSVPGAAAGLGAAPKFAQINPLLQKYACAACHSVDSKLVGPSFKEIAAKQGRRPDAQAYLAGKIKSGGQGVYGSIPMPAQSLSEAEAGQIASWLVDGAQK